MNKEANEQDNNKPLRKIEIRRSIGDDFRKYIDKIKEIERLLRNTLSIDYCYVDCVWGPGHSQTITRKDSNFKEALYAVISARNYLPAICTSYCYVRLQFKDGSTESFNIDFFASEYLEDSKQIPESTDTPI